MCGWQCWCWYAGLLLLLLFVVWCQLDKLCFVLVAEGPGLLANAAQRNSGRQGQAPSSSCVRCGPCRLSL